MMTTSIVNCIWKQTGNQLSSWRSRVTQVYQVICIFPSYWFQNFFKSSPKVNTLQQRKKEMTRIWAIISKTSQSRYVHKWWVDIKRMQKLSKRLSTKSPDCELPLNGGRHLCSLPQPFCLGDIQPESVLLGIESELLSYCMYASGPKYMAISFWMPEYHQREQLYLLKLWFNISVQLLYWVLLAAMVIVPIRDKDAKKGGNIYLYALPSPRWSPTSFFIAVLQIGFVDHLSPIGN